jgi:hypothetical protein
VDDRGNMIRLLAEARDFPSLQVALTSCGVQLPIQCVSGTFSEGVKLPGREADRSPLSSAAVAVHSSMCVHGVHRDNLSRLCCSNRYPVYRSVVIHCSPEGVI